MKPFFAKTTEKVALVGKLEPDKLKLFLDAERTYDGAVTVDDLTSVIKEFVPINCVNLDVLEDIAKALSRGEKIEDRRIAKGKAAEAGHEGKLLFLVKKFSDGGKVQIDSKGFAHYSDLHLFDNVKKGQIIARIYPPKKGVDGVDALGAPIPAAPGNPVTVSIEKNITQKKSPGPGDDFEILIAEEDGLITEHEGKIAVMSELFIKGDLDFHYGSIDFIGSVKIAGDVMQDFNVKAVKGITIGGAVRGSELICTEGDISVKGAIFGGQKGKVICARNFSATVAQELKVEAAGSIEINKEALDCVLRSESTIMMPEGKLVGGSAYAVCGIEAKTIGTEAEKETKIYLCSNVEAGPEFSKLTVELENHDRAIELLKLHLGPYQEHPERIQTLRPAFRAKMKTLYEKLQSVERSKKKIIDKKAELLQKAIMNNVMRVNVHGAFYPGVIVHAGQEKFTSNEVIKGPKSIDFLAKENKFAVSDYKPLECEVASKGPVEEKKK